MWLTACGYHMHRMMREAGTTTRSILAMPANSAFVSYYLSIAVYYPRKSPEIQTSLRFTVKPPFDDGDFLGGQPTRLRHYRHRP